MVDKYQELDMQDEYVLPFIKRRRRKFERIEMVLVYHQCECDLLTKV